MTPPTLVPFSGFIPMNRLKNKHVCSELVYSQRTYKFAIILTILVLRSLPLTLSGKDSFLNNLLGVKDVI